MRPLELTSQHFQSVADEVVGLATEFLSSLDALRIFPATNAAETQRLFTSDAPEQGLGVHSLAAIREVIQHCRAQNGRFFGYVQGPGEPIAALGDFIASILTQN